MLDASVKSLFETATVKNKRSKKKVTDVKDEKPAEPEQKPDESLTEPDQPKDEQNDEK